jgi:hypothetical protein
MWRAFRASSHANRQLVEIDAGVVQRGRHRSPDQFDLTTAKKVAPMQSDMVAGSTHTQVVRRMSLLYRV